MLGRKIKAGALQLTLFIIVAIALILAGFIILVHTHKRFNLQTDFIIETVQNANVGINYALLNTIKLNDTVSVNLNDEDYKTLKVHRELWGIFEKITSVSEIKNNALKKVALIGAKQLEQSRTTLYVQDNNRPLVVVGNTKIKGVAYLPKQGVRTGNIAGNSYYGSQLIYGQTKEASVLPKLFSDTSNPLQNIKNSISSIPQEHYLTVEPGKTYSNSFLKPLKVIYSPSQINLNAINLNGYIVVQSKTKIVVEASSNLKDVILVAPKIAIKSQVKGCFQAIATKEIRVDKNCKLSYPSALVVVEDKAGFVQNSNTQNKAINQIRIDENTTVKGVAVFLGVQKSNNYDAQVVIEKASTIYGEVYCTDNTELKGTVLGTIYTNNFVAKQSGSVYQNHIYNGIIDVTNLPQEYIGLTFKNSKKDVLKWLY